MKQAIKSTLAIAAGVASLASTIVAPSQVSAWGDNGGGRPSYTLDEINSGVLGDRIVFNSITTGNVIGDDEKNFVGIREDTGINAGINNKWFDDMTVEDGKTYIIRLYVHNNSPLEKAATAKDVRVSFSLPGAYEYSKSHEINGYISSANATPSEYWDYANFLHSDRPFRIEYQKGSAKVEDNDGTRSLSDDILTEEGVSLGDIPGCFQYAKYVTIRVKTYLDADYLVEKKVRLAGEKEWKYSVDAKVGDKVEFQIQYRNMSEEAVVHNNVVIRDVLPNNLRYVPGTATLYNGNHREGIKPDQDDALMTTGINIGNYKAGANAYVRFTAEVVDNNLACGSNAIVNWGQGGVDHKTIQDYAIVMTNKVCENTPEELPKTGPETLVGGVITTGAIVTVAGYYIASRRSLR